MKSKNNYCDGILPEKTWQFPSISSQRQRKHYVKESLSHPAKMPVFLCQKIIKEFTKPGNLILDPMAGIGTTLIEAALLGRNAVGIEYEEKFVKICQRNIEHLELFHNKGKQIGKAIILKGDSRQLSNVLNKENKEIGFVIFSPPYANISVRTGIDLKGRMHSRINLDKRKFTVADLKHVMVHEDIDVKAGGNYSKDNSNIGNFPFKEIDAIVTSPPFASEQVDKNSLRNKPTATYMKKYGYSDNYSDKKNIASKKYGSVDSILTSPLVNLSKETYLEAMLKIYLECFIVLKEAGLMVLVTKNFVRKGKMVRLDLNTIKLCELAGFQFIDRFYHKMAHASFWILNARKKFYQKNPDKIVGDPFASYEDILIFKKEGCVKNGNKKVASAVTC